MDINQRITEYGTNKLAGKLGVKPPTVSAWLSGKRPIPPDRAVEIAAILDCRPEEVSPRYLAGLERAEKFKKLAIFETKTDLDDPEPGDWTADVHDIELAAGDGTFIPDFIETRYRHTFSEDWRVRKGIKQGEKLFRHKVRGNSMYPVVGDGDVVLIRPSDKTIIDRRTYAIVLAGQLKVKKLVRRRDGGLEILSCNPEYPTEIVPADELDQVYIIGRVIDKSGDSGLDG